MIPHLSALPQDLAPYFMQVAGLHRACPSTTLDKGNYSIVISIPFLSPIVKRCRREKTRASGSCT